MTDLSERTDVPLKDCGCFCTPCLGEVHEACETPDECAEHQAIVEVVSGIIVRDGRMLMTQRLARQDYPLTWECPGGKLEPKRFVNEMKTETGGVRLIWALRRELREELGMDLQLTRLEPVWHGDIEQHRKARPGCRPLPPRLLRLTFLWVTSILGEARSREGQGFGWFSREMVHGAFLAMELTPGNARAHEAIMESAFGNKRGA
jgi:8-oxo-dGTP pyrophosphatase MutT (NUDIX family)